MKTSEEKLADKIEDYEEQLKELNSYLKELKDVTAKCGTDSAQFEEDLHEAEHNIEYYEGEIARIKEALGHPPAPPQTPAPKATPPQTGTDTILPRTPKQGLGSLIISSISFIAGAFLGSKLKSRGANKGEPKKK
jgi:TolA-binding protein